MLGVFAVYGVAPFAKASVTRSPAVTAPAPLPALHVPVLDVPLLRVPRLVVLPKLEPLRASRASTAVVLRPHTAVHHVRVRHVVRVPVVTDVVPAASAASHRTAPKAPAAQPAVVVDTIGTVPALPASDPAPAAPPAAADPQPRQQAVHSGTMELYDTSDAAPAASDSGTPAPPATDTTESVTSADRSAAAASGAPAPLPTETTASTTSENAPAAADSGASAPLPTGTTASVTSADPPAAADGGAPAPLPTGPPAGDSGAPATNDPPPADPAPAATISNTVPTDSPTPVPPDDPADLVAVLSGPATLVSGVDASFDLAVTNNGPDAATNFSIGWTGIGWTGGSGPGPIVVTSTDRAANCSPGNRCAIATLAAGATVHASVTLHFTGAATSASLTAGVTSDRADQPDPNTANDTARASFTVRDPAADLAATVTGPSTLIAGADASFDLAVTNNGPDAATNFSIGSIAVGWAGGPGPGPISVTSTDGNCSAGDRCAIATLAAGATIHAGISFHFNGAATSATLTAGITSDRADQADRTTANDTSTATFTVRELVTPTVALSAEDDSGASHTDGITNVVDPFFVVSGNPNFFTELFDTTTSIGSATADMTGVARIRPAQPLVDGVHSLTARQSFTGGTTDFSAPVQVTIDTVAPAAPVLDLPATQDSGSSSTDNVTNVNDWALVAGSTTSERAFGFLHELSPNGRELTGGAYNANLPGWGFAGTFAPAADAAGGLGADGRQGVWTYTAWVIDLAGNQSATSNTLAITFDTIAPDAPVLDLPAGQDSGASASDNITNVNYWRVVSGSANETARGFLHELSPNGRELTGGAYNANLPGWGFGGTFAPAADAAGGLGPDGRQGVWTYTAWVIDLAGNQSATSNPLAITFDTIAPDAPLLDLPADQDSGASASDNITNVNDWRVISGSANETARGFLHELSPNGRELTGGAYNANLPGWGFGGTFAPAADAAGGLGPDGRQGVWTYTAWAVDLAGNQSATSNPLAITFDTVAPTGDFSLAGTVINGQLATATTSEAVTLAYSEGPVEYSISTDGGATTSSFAPYIAGATAALTNGDGIYTVVVLVRDAAGNTVSVTHTVRLDTTGPTIAVSSPATSVDVALTVPFIYSATDVDTVAAQTATLDGAPIANGASIDTGTLAAGVDHTIVVTAKDGLGNTSTVTYVFRVHATVAGLKRAVTDGVRRGAIATQMQTPLLAKLNASALADFISQVRAQSGKKISAAYATLLIGWATDLLARRCP